MLAYIKGKLEYVNNDSVVIENNGMGYLVKTSGNVLSKLPQLHGEVMLYTHMYVREDEISLYGFSTREELAIFGLLIGISGVGPKAAISILSTLTVDELKLAVLSEDAKAIAKANGVGAKGAQRIIIDLKDKLHIEDMFDTTQEQVCVGVQTEGDVYKDASLALCSMGFSNSEVLRAIKKIPTSDTMTTEDLLKAALKHMI